MGYGCKFRSGRALDPVKSDDALRENWYRTCEVLYAEKALLYGYPPVTLVFQVPGKGSLTGTAVFLGLQGDRVPYGSVLE